MELKDIESVLPIENSQIEFKARLDRNDPSGWLKTIAAFANTNGGYLYIGVEDKTTKLIGFTKEEVDKEKLFLFHTLKEHMNILPELTIQSIPYLNRDKERYILKVEVHESPSKPLFMHYGGYSSIFLRKDGYTSLANEEEARRLFLTQTQKSFDQILTDKEYHEEDFQEYFKFCEENSQKKPTFKELASLPFFDDTRHLYQGSYLFSDHCQNQNTKVVCSIYAGKTKGDDAFISSQNFQGSLIQDFNFIMDFIRPRILEKIIKKDTSHVVIKSYPLRSVFEGVINALAHRNYFMDNSQISIDFFSNRLVISSPGDLFMVGEMKYTHDLSSFISRRRNELICSCFILAGAMEAKGTGLEKISEDYKDADITHKPYIFSKNGQFSLVLPDLNNEEGIDFLDDSLIFLSKVVNPSRFDEKVLSYCFGANRSIAEISAHCGVSSSSFFRSIIRNLASQNFLLSEKRGNRNLYTTNPNLVHIR